MSAPLVPSPLDYIGRRKFSFYPPIANAEPNEWLRGTGSWSEVQVVNATTGQEIWIPRQYIGGVSDGPGLHLVVELSQELCYQRGVLAPRVKRIIQMPRPREPESKLERKRSRRRSGPASVVGIKVETESSSALRSLGQIGLAVVAFLVLAALVLALARL
ncbi:MAG: hypothetical protein JO061_01295 [Acidobacteriaceae bacterium]|nr:hypothetical protein [Acidobacteriaceae bacterium]